MTIELTKDIAGKKVKLNLITLNGKTKIRKENFNELKKQGLTKKDIEDSGYGIEE